MKSLSQQLSGEVYSLHTGESGSFTVHRFCFVEDSWILQESVSLPTADRQRIVAFETVDDVLNASKCLFLALEVSSSTCGNSVQIYKCDRKPLRLVQLISIPVKGTLNNESYHLFRGPQLAFISDGALCLLPCDPIIIRTRPIGESHLKEILIITAVQSNHLFVTRSKNSVHFILNRKTRFDPIPPKHFLPKDYLSLIQSIDVTIPLYVAGVWTALKRNVTCISTSNKCFVVFVYGVVRYTCTIPFGDVCRIKPYQTAFVLKSKHRGVCAVKRVNRKIQVSQIWNEAREALIGDFANSGRSCLLLLKDEEFSASGVIDLSGYEKGGASVSHLSTVVGALQKRLHIAQHAVARAEDEAQQKTRLINAIQWKIPNDPTLVVILGSKRPVVSSPISIPIEVTNHWNSIYRDVIVMGWTAQCQNGAKHFQVHLAVPNQCCEYKQAIIGNDHETNIILLAKMPTFVTPVVKVTATLSWQTTENCHEWKSFDIFLKVSEFFTNVALAAKGLQHLECLRLAQQKFSFRLSPGQRKIVENVLSNQHLHTMHLPNQTKVYAFTAERFPLFGVNFQIKSDLEIHFRDRAQLLLFVHWFYNTIPEGFFLLPTSSQYFVTAKDCLKEELQLVHESITLLPEKYRQFRDQLFKQELKTDWSFYHLISHQTF